MKMIYFAVFTHLEPIKKKITRSKWYENVYIARILQNYKKKFVQKCQVLK